MTEYRRRHTSFDEDGCVEIPDNAEGITIDTSIPGYSTVQYLVPVEDDA